MLILCLKQQLNLSTDVFFNFRSTLQPSFGNQWGSSPDGRPWRHGILRSLRDVAAFSGESSGCPRTHAIGQILSQGDPTIFKLVFSEFSSYSFVFVPNQRLWGSRSNLFVNRASRSQEMLLRLRNYGWLFLGIWPSPIDLILNMIVWTWIKLRSNLKNVFTPFSWKWKFFWLAA